MDLFILFIITETNSPLVSQLLRQRHGGGPSVSAAGGTWTVCAERRSASHRRSVSGRSQSHTAGCTHTHWLTASETVCAETATGSESYPPPPKKKETERRCVQVTVPEAGVASTGCRWRAGEGRCDVQTAAAGRGAHLQRALSEDELESCRLETDSVVVWRVRSSKSQKNTPSFIFSWTQRGFIFEISTPEESAAASKQCEVLKQEHKLKNNLDFLDMIWITRVKWEILCDPSL